MCPVPRRDSLLPRSSPSAGKTGRALLFFSIDLERMAVPASQP